MKKQSWIFGLIFAALGASAQADSVVSITTSSGYERESVSSEMASRLSVARNYGGWEYGCCGEDFVIVNGPPPVPVVDGDYEEVSPPPEPVVAKCVVQTEAVVFRPSSVRIDDTGPLVASINQVKALMDQGCGVSGLLVQGVACTECDKLPKGISSHKALALKRAELVKEGLQTTLARMGNRGFELPIEVDSEVVSVGHLGAVGKTALITPIIAK